MVKYTCYLVAEIVHNPLTGNPPTVRIVCTRSDPSTVYRPTHLHEARVWPVIVLTMTSSKSYADAAERMDELLQNPCIPSWIREYLENQPKKDWEEYRSYRALIAAADATAIRPYYTFGGCIEPETLT